MFDHQIDVPAQGTACHGNGRTDSPGCKVCLSAGRKPSDLAPICSGFINEGDNGHTVGGCHSQPVALRRPSEVQPGVGLVQHGMDAPDLAGQVGQNVHAVPAAQNRVLARIDDIA